MKHERMQTLETWPEYRAVNFQCWFSALKVKDQVEDLIAHINREFSSV